MNVQVHARVDENEKAVHKPVVASSGNKNSFRAPLNLILLVSALFFVFFAFFTLPGANDLISEELNEDEVRVPEPFEEYDGVRRNLGETVTKNGDLVTNYPAGNLLCLALGQQCPGDISVPPSVSDSDEMLTPIGLDLGAAFSGTTPIIEPGSGSGSAQAPRLAFREAINRRGSDGKICTGLSREEARAYLCNRGLGDPRAIWNVMSAAVNGNASSYCLEETSEAYCETWTECVRNITRTHFSIAKKDAPLGFLNAITFSFYPYTPLDRELKVLFNPYDTTPGGTQVGICSEFA